MTEKPSYAELEKKRKELEQELKEKDACNLLLKEKEEKYRSLLEGVGDIVFSLDTEGRIDYINSAVFPLLGYTPEEITGCLFYPFIHPNDLSRISEGFQDVKQGRIRPREFRLRRKNGSYCWVRSSSRPIVHGDTVSGVRGILIDFTRQKRFEEVLFQRRTMSEPSADAPAKDKTALAEPEDHQAPKTILHEFLHIPLFQELFDSLYETTGIPTAVLDTQENILTASGWQDLCTKFHRVHAETRKMCIESDQYIKANMPEEGYAAYECANGLWDFAIPIRIGKQHIATFFFGQVFLEKNEDAPYAERNRAKRRERFLNQARKYGFDETEYLKAFENIPVITEDYLEVVMRFCDNLASIIVFMGSKNLDQIRLTQQKNEIALLRLENENRLNLLVENAPVGIFFYDTRLCITDCNEQFGDILHTRRNNLISLDMRKLKDTRILPALEDVLQNGEGFYEGPYETTLSGKAIWIRMRTKTVYHTDGSIRGGVGIVEDITELQKKELEYAVILETALDGFWVIDREGRILAVNQSVCDMLGYTKEELLHMHIFEIEDIESSGEVKKRIDQVIHEGGMVFETRHKRKDGNIIDVDVSCRYLPYEGGRFVVFIRDITEKKKARENLETLSERLTLATRAAMVGIWDYNVTNNILRWDESMVLLYGQEPGMYSGGYETWLSFVHPEDREKAHMQAQNAIAGRSDYNTEFRIMLPDQSIRHLRAVGKIIRDEKGDPARMIGVNWDITAYKTALREMSRYNRLFESVIRQAPFAAHVIEGDEEHIYVVIENEESRRIMGEAFEHKKHINAKNDSATMCRYYTLDRTREIPLSGMPSIRALKGEVVKGEEYVFVHPDKTQILVEANATPIYGENGNILAVLVTFHDITKRKLAEEAVRKSEEKYRSLFMNAPVGIFQSTPKGRYKTMNPAFARMTGFSSPKEMMEEITNISELYVDPQAREEVKRLLVENGEIIGHEIHLYRKNGSTMWMSIFVKLIQDENGGEDYYDGFSLDITEQKFAEIELRESEEKFRSFVENANDIVYSLTPEGIFTYVSPNFREMLGYEPDEVLGRDFSGFVHPEDVHICRNFLNEVLETEKKLSSVEYRSLHKDGSIHWHVSNGSVYFDRKRGANSYIGIARDITEQKRAEAERYRLATAVEQAAECVMITDTEGKIEYVNPAFEVITGYTREEAIGKNPRILNSGTQDIVFYKNMWETIKAGNVWSGRIVNQKKDGTFFTEECTISPIRDANRQISKYVAVKHDVTRTLELEKQLFQSQKIEAIGTLAGGIAHDFNNILFPIIGYAEMMEEYLPNESNARENLKEILKAAKRARDLISQILTFSRKTQQYKSNVTINSIVKEAVKLLRSTIPSYIEIQETITKTGRIMADLNQIHQIVVNLCTNAYHAMRQRGGVMEVSLKEREIRKEEMEAMYPGAEHGKYVILSVSDTGTGMDEETRKRIFEPYFTTKQPNEGTGLGLAVVDGIVRDHNGFVLVESRPGRGSLFAVFFPVTKEKEIKEEKTETPGIATGDERILLVDDDMQVLKMVYQMLDSLGYEVTMKFNSVEALELFWEAPQRFDLVITDMTMPNLPGDQLTRQLKEIRQDIPVIICTGYSERMNETRIKELGVAGYLMKPLLKQELASAVRRALDERQTK